jgi:transposase-like protein
MAWRKSFIQASSILGTVTRTTPEKAQHTCIIEMLMDALKYAEEEDGQVPTSHIDYVYDRAVEHIKASQKKNCK